MILVDWFRYLADWWPLARKRPLQAAVRRLEEYLRASGEDYRSQIARLSGTLRFAEDHAAIERRRADRAEALASRLREVVDALTRDVPESYLIRNPAWRHQGRQLIREVDRSLGRLAFAAMTRPDVAVMAHGPARPVAVRQADIEMLRVGFQLGLSDGCPPEAVADAVAEKVRAAVLEQWKGQAVLGGGAL